MLRLRRALPLLWALSPLTVCGQDSAPAVIEVRLNGQAPVVVLGVQRGAVLHLSGAAVRALGLRMPAATPAFEEDGEPYFPLEALGLTLRRLDLSEGKAEISAPASAFPATAQSLQLPSIEVTPASPAAYLNYDLLMNSAEKAVSGSGLFDLVGTSRFGSLTHSFVNRNLGGGDGVQRGGMERLATTYRHDWINSPATLELGDTTARPGAFGLPLRFGGLALYSNYGLRPGFVTQPLPRFSGEAVTPSTVDVFVNGQLRRSVDVPAGPFTLNEVPVITGAGQVRLVIRDALGREQLVNASFYSAGRLLRSGLSQYALSAGTLRRQGVVGAPEYANGYLSALWRQGMTDALTLEARAEMEAGVTRVAGFAAAFALPAGEAELSGAVNGTEGQTHWLGGVGYRYLSPRRSATLRWDESDRGFRLAGVLDPLLATQRLITATASQQLDNALSLNVGWIEQRNASDQTQRSANVGLAWSLPGGGNFLLSVARVSYTGGSSDSLRLTLNLPLGADHLVSVGTEGGSVRQNSVTLQRALPLSEGVGYRVFASDGDNGTRTEASVRAQARAVLLSAETSVVQNQPGLVRFGARGSLGMVGGAVFAARSIDDSFALVNVPGVADVPVLLNSQPAGRTDSKGRLVLPRVSALVPNRVEADVDALPPEVTVLNERTSFVAGPRSAVIATLALKRVASALVRVTRVEGGVPPPGTPVQAAEGVEVSRVGPRGEIFVRAQPGPLRIKLQLDDTPCSIEFVLPQPLPFGAFHEIGPLPCQRAKP